MGRTTKKQEAEYARRKARAEREANRAEDLLTLPLRERAARARGRAKRGAALAEISAKVEADRAPHSISPEQYKALPLNEREDIRFGRKKGRKLGVEQKKTTANANATQIKAAIDTFFKGSPRHKTNPKWTGERIAGELWHFHSNYFPDGRPHIKWDAFLKKVRLALAKINPKHRAS